MDLDRAIKRVERYRDDIVTHGMTREAMTTVVESARETTRLREGVQEIIDARCSGNFDALLPKMRALLEEA